ncbi:phosphoribosyltransferase domain-containing protein [Curtobacterium sp. MCJR17_043]|nr:phosphoribosyltransferase domain-containing protein [Curtobacterium sp. MCJR17_043]WIB35030.1 phosphoribosyltransferase domain-containing protein [Curtobacterium sp. MCJR17_043]
MTTTTLPTPADLGVELVDDRTAPGDTTVPLSSLVRLALRRNPKRAHLLVSTVLAKHVPTVPAVALLAGEALGARVADVLDGGARFDAGAAGRFRAVLDAQASAGDAAAHDALHRTATTLRTDLAASRPAHPEALVLGFAETATALGAMVAESLGAATLHSTRHELPRCGRGSGLRRGALARHRAPAAPGARRLVADRRHGRPRRRRAQHGCDGARHHPRPARPRTAAAVGGGRTRRPPLRRRRRRDRGPRRRTRGPRGRGRARSRARDAPPRTSPRRPRRSSRPSPPRSAHPVRSTPAARRATTSRRTAAGPRTGGPSRTRHAPPVPTRSPW